MVWAWSHPENMEFSSGEFDALPPRTYDLDGNLVAVGYTPDHTIIALDDHLKHHEMREVMENHADIRWHKQPDNSWKLYLRRHDPETKETEEEEHHLQKRIERRRGQKADNKQEKT